MNKNTDYNKKKRWLLCFVGVAAFSCAVFIGIKVFYQTLMMPPAWVCYTSKKASLKEYSLEVSGKKAVLSISASQEQLGVTVNAESEEKRIVWTSPSQYKVQDGFLTDIDRDGDTEIVLLLWKKGRFGSHRPFWVLSDEKNYSQHIFIYDIENITEQSDSHDIDEVEIVVKQKWFASDIGIQLRRMKLMERDDSILLAEDIEGNNTLWKWDSFGLKNMKNEVTVVAFGDNIIHRAIYEYGYLNKSGNFDFLYEPFKDEIENADIAAVCAETVLVDKKSAVSDYPRFGTPIAVGEALVNAGFDVLACASNHALDKGIYGIDVTKSFYENNGVTCVGIQKSDEKNYRPYEIISKNGMQIAFLSYTYGTNGIDISDKYPYAVHCLPQISADTKNDEQEFELFIKEVSSAREVADFIVVYVHWGDEYNDTVSDYQRKVASLLAKAGVDVVIGSHPHTVQETEVIERADGGRMLVFYSLGNFRANQRKNSISEGNSKEESVYTSNNISGAEASFAFEYTYDGVELKSWDMKYIDFFAP